MSTTVFNSGKLVLRSDRPESFAKEYLNQENHDLYDSFLENLLDEYSEFVVLDGKLYEIEDLFEVRDSHAFVKIYPSSDGSLDFLTNYYNDGVSLNEMLKAGFKDYMDEDSTGSLQ